jgi:hypothetical protein
MKTMITMIIMVIFMTTLAYAVNTPVIIEITHNGTNVTLDWNPVLGADFYKVFVCDTPYGVYVLDETGSFPTQTSWTKPEPSNKKFYQVSAVDGPAPVNLGTAGNFVILAASAISTNQSSDITGNMGISPAAASYITGFSLILDASGIFSTSNQVDGNVYAADYFPPTPGNMTTAISDMETAYAEAAARPNPDFINLLSGNISGQTLAPGIYKWNGGVTINTPVTLTGAHDDVWIFQISEGINMAPNASIILGAGAQAKNIFWQAFGPVLLGTDSHLEGIVLCSTAIILDNGASVNGRLLAHTAINLDQNIITEPTP